MEATLGVCLSPLDSHSTIACPVWIEEKPFPLSSSGFSILWSLFYNNELIYVCRTDFVSSALLKLKYFIVIFSTFYNLSLLLRVIVQQNGVTRDKLLKLARGICHTLTACTSLKVPSDYAQVANMRTYRSKTIRRTMPKETYM
jgi:hypothetical protein